MNAGSLNFELDATIAHMLGTIDLGVDLQQLAALTDQYAKYTAQLTLAAQAQQEFAQKLADTRRVMADAQSPLAKAAGPEPTVANLPATQAAIVTAGKDIGAKTGTKPLDAPSGVTPKEDFTKTAEDLDKFLNVSKIEIFGAAWKNAFGIAGDSVAKLAISLQQLSGRQEDVEKQRSNAANMYLNGAITEEKYVAAIDELNLRSTKNRLAGYGDMASAAAGFFDKQSRGYQSLMVVSQVFHAAELAMTMAELVPKATGAVLNQGGGDPYSAFGRMAAMAALVAGLGVATGGIGGGDTTAVTRQKANGTGSILGDSDAKTVSIKNSLKVIESNTYQHLAINTNMLTVLRSIDSGINGVSNMLFRTDGFSTKTDATRLGSTADFAASDLGQFLMGGALGVLLNKLTGGWLGNIAGKIGNAIFGGNVHTIDTGITLDKGTLGQIVASGANVSQYADTRTDGGWFHSDKYGTTLADLGNDIDAQFTLLFRNMQDAILQSAAVLGISGEAFNKKLAAFIVDIGKISTKDLKPADVQKALQNAISKVGDDMAKFAVDGLQHFQNAGEGALETLTRIAAEYQTVDVVFQSFGKTFRLVGLESVAARDRLINLAGGLDKFTSQGQYFLENFFSKQEQADALKARIDPTLATYGLSTDGSNASKLFRDFVVGLDTTTEAGAQAYTTLMALAPAFKQVVDAYKKTGVSQDELDERKGLQNQLDELTMTSIQLREKERASISDSNKALYDRVQAIKDANDNASTLLTGVDNSFAVLQKVVDREKAAVQKTIDTHTEAVNRLRGLSQSLRGALDSMKSTEQKLLDRASAQAEIRADLAITKAGGTLSDGQIESLKKALGAVTQDTSSQFSLYTDYLRDLYQTQGDIAALANITDNSLSVEEEALQKAKEQLTSLDAILSNAQEQINVLKGQSTTLLSIEQAIKGLADAIGAAKANPIVSATSAVNTAYQTVLGRAPDAAGLEYWQQRAAEGAATNDIVDAIMNSPEAKVRALYQTLLGRTADAAGVDYWLSSGMSIDEISAAIKGSDEYGNHKSIPGFANGGDHSGGVRLVGEIGPEVEATGPSRIHSTRDLVSVLRGPGDSEATLAAAVERLEQTIADQQEALNKIQSNTKRYADGFEQFTQGGKYMPTKDFTEA